LSSFKDDMSTSSKQTALEIAAQKDKQAYCMSLRRKHVQSTKEYDDNSPTLTLSMIPYEIILSSKAESPLFVTSYNVHID